MPNLLTLKPELYHHCRQRLQAQIDSLEIALASVTESRNNETKSSVGDKYETGRAMMQLEAEKYQIQLANLRQTKNVLDSLDPLLITTKAALGSLVITDTGNYYLAVSIGKIKLEDKFFYVISLDAPLGRALLNKCVGENIQFNGKSIQILAIS